MNNVIQGMRSAVLGACLLVGAVSAVWAQPTDPIGQIKSVRGKEPMDFYKEQGSTEKLGSVDPATLQLPMPYFDDVDGDADRLLVRLDPWGLVWLAAGDRVKLSRKMEAEICTSALAEKGAMVVAGQRSAGKGCKRN